MDILPLGERRIIFSRIGLARGEDGRPEVTRIHPNLFFAGAPCRLGGHYTSMERPDMSFSASSERAANGGLVFRPSFQTSSFRRNPTRACEGWHFASQSTRSASWPDYRPSKQAVSKLKVSSPRGLSKREISQTAKGRSHLRTPSQFRRTKLEELFMAPSSLALIPSVPLRGTL
jgi:hypothetical protein